MGSCPIIFIFELIFEKLLSSGQFALSGPDTLFSHFISICSDFLEILGIHGKLGISVLNFFFYCFDTPAKRLVSLSSTAFKSQIFMVENSH